MLRAGRNLVRHKKRWAAGFMAILIVVSSIIFLIPPKKAAAALQTKVGTFAVPAATGNFDVHSVGFQPKAVIFWANRRTAAGSGSSVTANANMPEVLMGMMDGTSQASFSNSDDFTSGDPFLDTTHCLISRYGNSLINSIAYQATFVQWYSDGFQLNFGTVQSGVIINYMAIGGTGITGAKIISHALPTSAGNQQFTGAGFTPDAAILIGGTPQSGFTQAESSGGMGFMTTSNQMSLSSGYASSAGTSGANVAGGTEGAFYYQRNDKAYVEIAGGIKRFEATLSGSAFDSDGFTLNFSTATGTGSTSTIYALCLKGARFKVGATTQKISSTGNLAESGVGFTPQAIFLASALHASSTSIGGPGGIFYSVGATDGTTQSVVASESGAHGNDTYSQSNVYKALADDTTPTVNSAAAYTSFDATGFTLNYSPTDSTAREIIYFVLAPAAVGSAPATPTIILPAASATNISDLPLFMLRTTDADNDYLKYYIEIYDATACGGTLVTTADQTSSQTGWAGQDKQTASAYTGSSAISNSTVARYQYSGTPLTANHLYSWRAKAIDPGGSNSFSSFSSCADFTTATNEVQIQGGTTIQGGSTIQ